MTHPNKPHPTQAELALYAGSDSGPWARLLTWRHVRSCAECQREVHAFRAGHDSLMALGEAMPAEIDWTSLAPVMRANIHVGLSAAECIANVGTGRTVYWTHARIAWASVAAVVFVVGGWVVQVQAPKMPAPMAAATATAPARFPGETVLRATVGMLEMERDGRAMMLTYDGPPAASSVTVAAHALNAQYIDNETGQVTIHHVYAE